MKEIIKYLETKPIDEIIELCNDIYTYRYITGMISSDSIINRYAEESKFNIWDICGTAEEYVSDKFEKLIKLSFLQKPYKYISYT